MFHPSHRFCYWYVELFVFARCSDLWRCHNGDGGIVCDVITAGHTANGHVCDTIMYHSLLYLYNT